MLRASPRTLVSLTVLVGACTSEPQSPAESGAVAPGTEHVSESRAAFLPRADNGSCAKGYGLAEGVCVFDAYRASLSPDALSAQVALYRRGAAPPLVGAIERLASPQAAQQVRKGSALDPGALRAADALDADAAKRARIAALDRMIAQVAAKRGAEEARSGTQPASTGAPPAGSTGMGPVRTQPELDATGDEGDARVSRLSAMLRELGPAELNDALAELEAAGARRELGEDTWRTLTKGVYVDTQGVDGR